MHRVVKCSQIKHTGPGYRPESLIELVYYNLILIWRKKTGKTNLCVWDLSSGEIDKFKEGMRNKGYLKTDCWCKHIEEFKNGLV